MFSVICIILFFLLISHSPSLDGATFNLTLPHQHPNPEAVVHDVQRRILISTSNLQSKDQQPGLTGNPIDDCWQCDPNWANDPQHLADCAIGFGQGAAGGKGGQIYVVTDSSDNNVADPTPGTLRHAVIQIEPLWITFSVSMEIKLAHELVVGSHKTIDGRGANVYITGNGCITLKDVSNVIIHNIHVYDCKPSEGADIRLSPTQLEHKGKSDGDGFTIRGSSNIWVDHCAVSQCTDGLIDVTEGSTAITISNNYFSHHDKVMLLGHSDDYTADIGMQVTVAFNHFGKEVAQRMPRCRYGFFHVVNNDYTGWKMYAVGGSAKPTIHSQGNRYAALPDGSSKEVTKRLDIDEGEWKSWNWITDGDLMVNGAYFVASGQGLGPQYVQDVGVEPRSAAMIDQITSTAGVLGGPRDNGDRITYGGWSGSGEEESGGIHMGSGASPVSMANSIVCSVLTGLVLYITTSNGIFITNTVTVLSL